MKSSELSLLSLAEKATTEAYHVPRQKSVILSEIISRIAAGALLSLAAALDMIFHSLMALPTFVYCIGHSIYHKHADFTLPWQHIQRVRNSIAPIFLGSLVGLIEPHAGIGMCEPSDKHAIVGMLSSNAGKKFDTFCSPTHSLSIVEDLAEKHRFTEVNGEKKEIFTKEHIKVIGNAKCFEKSLQIMQGQEIIHKVTNVTLLVMSKIKHSIEDSRLGSVGKAILSRLSVLLVPFLTGIDFTINLLAQAFFLTTGFIRLISGRGPIFTDATMNPLMHVSFLIQNVLKTVGNLIGTLISIVSPTIGFKASLMPSHLFFKMQMLILMLQIRIKMYFADENSRFVLPILYGNGNFEALGLPAHGMHMTYLIVEKKKQGAIDLYWVNRPHIKVKRNLDTGTALTQIRSMLDVRFPFMDMDKVASYPIIGQRPPFSDSTDLKDIPNQGNQTNCVVSNLFGVLETIDRLNGDDEINKLRYTVARQALMKDYSFYRGDFFPTLQNDGFSLNSIWRKIETHAGEPI
jgi:hypothetical protein